MMMLAPLALPERSNTPLPPSSSSSFQQEGSATFSDASPQEYKKLHTDALAYASNALAITTINNCVEVCKYEEAQDYPKQCKELTTERLAETDDVTLDPEMNTAIDAAQCE